MQSSNNSNMQDLRTYRIKAGFSRSSQKKGERNNFSYAAQAFSTSFYEPSTARLKQTKQNKKADGKKMPSLKLANSSPAWRSDPAQSHELWEPTSSFLPPPRAGEQGELIWDCIFIRVLAGVSGNPATKQALAGSYQVALQ